MNDRIKELAEQASTFAFTEYPKQTMATFNTNKSLDQLFNQKFAQLIVAECVAQVWTVSEMEHKGNILSECSKRMRKYFGVEE